MRDVPIFVLAGGFGTRMNGWRSSVKGMVDVDGQPIVARVVGQYLRSGFERVFILGGYEIDTFRQGFSRFFESKGWALRDGPTATRGSSEIHLVDTGWSTPDLLRLEQALQHVPDDALIGITYGDSLASIDLVKSLVLARASQKSTMLVHQRKTTVGRVALDASESFVLNYEKNSEILFINAGYMFIWKSVIQDVIAMGKDNVDDLIKHLISKNMLLVGEIASRWFGFDSPGDVVNCENNSALGTEFDFPDM